MKKLLSLLATAPLVATSCISFNGVDKDVQAPETPDNGGSNPADPADPVDPAEPIRDIMNETEIEDFLSERSFMVLASDGTHSGTGMGSGWLIDESEDNWYVATNRHVTEALDNGDGTVMITNDWDRMWQDYNRRDHSYNVDGNGIFSGTAESVMNPQTSAEIHFLFEELRQTADLAEIVYESVDPNAGSSGGSTAIDYYDYAVVKIDKATSMIDPLVEPIEIAPFDYVKEQYSYYHETRYFFRGYSFANGNYRYGSFFNNTYINAYNRVDAKAWSPSVAYDPPGVETYSNWGFDNGPGSSGSAMIDERGYYVSNNTFGYSSVYVLNQSNAAGNPANFHHSGTSGQGVIDTVLPEYFQTLSEKTLLCPTC